MNQDKLRKYKGVILCMVFLSLHACRNSVEEVKIGEEFSLEAPSSLSTHVISDESIALRWVNPSVTQDFQISIEVMEEGGADEDYQEVAVIENANEYIVTHLSPDTSYQFRMYAFNTTEVSTNETVAGKTLQSGGSHAPSAVSITSLQLTQSAAPFEFTLKFLHPSYSNVDYYEIKKVVSGSPNKEAVYTTKNTNNQAVTIVDSDSAKLFVSGGVYLASQDNTNHDYRVKACNAIACSSVVSQNYTISTSSSAKPVFTGLSATSNQTNQITVSWNFSAGSFDTVDSLVLTRDGSNGSIYTWNNPNDGSTPNTSMIDSSTSNGLNYTYELTLTYTSGLPQTATVTGKSVASAPNQMTVPVFGSISQDHYEPGYTQIDFSWAHPGTNMGYANFIVKLQRKEKGQAWSSASSNIAFVNGTGSQTVTKYGYINVQAPCISAVYKEYDMRVYVIAQDPDGAVNGTLADSEPAYSNAFTCYSHLRNPSIGSISFAPQGLGSFENASTKIYYSTEAKYYTLDEFEAEWSQRPSGAGAWSPMGSSFVMATGAGEYDISNTTYCLGPSAQVRVRVRALSSNASKHSSWVEKITNCP